MTDLVVQSAIREPLTDQNVSADFYDALDGEVEDLLADAARRAEDNDRKTVQPRDLRLLLFSATPLDTITAFRLRK